MRNSLRLLVLSGTLALLASPAAFADGPGGNVPPPPIGGGTSTTTNSTTNSTSTTSTTTILGEIITILGTIGF